MEEHKAQREPIEIPPEFVQELHGRGFGKIARIREAAQAAQRFGEPLDDGSDPSSRPEPTQRTRRDTGPFCRATAGHVVWRGVPSRFQVREPSKYAQAFHQTQSPPWKRKAKARRKAKLQKASRKVNRVR